MSAPHDRYAGVTQAIRLVGLLRLTPRTRAELAARLGVHERTIRRLIDALRAGGVQIDQARVPPSPALVYRVHD